MPRVESSVERAACAKIYRELGVTCVKFVSPGRRGYQDRWALVPGGRPLLMEFKRAGEDLDPLQVHRRNELVKLGYDVVGPVTTVEEAFEAVALRVLKYRKTTCVKTEWTFVRG